jgi:hypothetical protein
MIKYCLGIFYQEGIKIQKRIIMISMLVFLFYTVLTGQDYFEIVERFDIGPRAFHIDTHKNYATVCDYDGKVTVFDIYTLEYFSYSSCVRPMAGFFNGEYLYVIDNYRKEVLKLRGNTVIKRVSLGSNPVNMKTIDNKIFISAFDPDKLFVFDKNLSLIQSIDLSVKSPFLQIAGKDLYIPMRENTKDNTITTRFLFYNATVGSYIVNYQNIRSPIDILEYNNRLFIASYYNGKIYENLVSGQKEVATFGGYLINIELFNSYIVGNSLFGGIYFYDIEKKGIVRMLEDIPIVDIAVSPSKNYIFALSSIENKLFIIKDFQVYQEIKLDDYPIDVEVPDESVIIVLSTQAGKVQVIRKF